jgi:hypothetical protein
MIDIHPRINNLRFAFFCYYMVRTAFKRWFTIGC